MKRVCTALMVAGAVFAAASVSFAADKQQAARKAPVKMTAAQIGRTLQALAAEPARGRAVVLEAEGGARVGYALLIAFYSNEWGGLTCELDELYVQEAYRGRGLGSALFAQIAGGAFGAFEAITLIATPDNARARRLYERSGFRVVGTTLGRAIEREPAGGEVIDAGLDELAHARCGRLLTPA